MPRATAVSAALEGEEAEHEEHRSAGDDPDGLGQAPWAEDDAEDAQGGDGPGGGIGEGQGLAVERDTMQERRRGGRGFRA